MAFVLRSIRRWVRVYTAGLPPAARSARRAEIESDLFEHVRSADGRGVPTPVLVRQLLGRALLGIPGDATWRLRTGLRARSEARRVMRRAAEGSAARSRGRLRTATFKVATATALAGGVAAYAVAAGTGPGTNGAQTGSGTSAAGVSSADAIGVATATTSLHDLKLDEQDAAVVGMSLVPLVGSSDPQVAVGAGLPESLQPGEDATGATDPSSPVTPATGCPAVTTLPTAPAVVTTLPAGLQTWLDRYGGDGGSTGAGWMDNGGAFGGGIPADGVRSFLLRGLGAGLTEQQLLQIVQSRSFMHAANDPSGGARLLSYVETDPELYPRIAAFVAQAPTGAGWGAASGQARLWQAFPELKAVYMAMAGPIHTSGRSYEVVDGLIALAQRPGSWGELARTRLDQILGYGRTARMADRGMAMYLAGSPYVPASPTGVAGKAFWSAYAARLAEVGAGLPIRRWTPLPGVDVAVAGATPVDAGTDASGLPSCV